jgi:cyclopropane fatty-acyl-phospholipid synthase-like methyltransferase
MTGAPPNASPSAAGDDGWRGYWERIDDAQLVFSVEARDYAARVRRLIGLEPDMSVLDFGCGFGHTSRALAGDVANVALWDASANVRREALARIADVANAELVDFTNPHHDFREHFDLILVHSVLQYMSADEITMWLARWRRMLRPGGRVALSDLIVPGAGGPGELVSYLFFALRHGFFCNAFVHGVRETASYWRARQSRPLTVVTRPGLEAWAATAGFDVEWLRENLSHRSARATAVLRATR